MSGLKTRLRHRYKSFRRWKKHVYNSKNSFGISFVGKLRTNLAGFTADQYTLYDLAHNDPADYITEYERWVGEDINGVFAPMMSEKILLSNLFDDIRTPEIYFWVEQGQCYSSEGRIQPADALAGIRKQGKAIAKPTHSMGHGFGLYVISEEKGQLYVNGEAISEKDLLSRISLSEGFIFCEFAEQAEYARNFYPGTTNTVRVISIWRKKEEEPKIILAGQRIGTDKSWPADGVASGGLSVLVDVDSGTLQTAKNYDNQTFRVHPDSGAQIEGVVIPHWEQIKNSLLNSHRKRRYLKFIAWDVIVTDEDFYICEVNRGTGFGMFQIFEGLKNTELGELYREYGIIR